MDHIAADAAKEGPDTHESHDKITAEGSEQASNSSPSGAGPVPIIADSGAPSIQLLDIRIAENQMLSDFYERKVMILRV